MDDLLSSFKNEDEAINTVQNVKTALKEASFNLTSFASNSSAVAASLNYQNQTSNNATVVKIPDENMTTTSALGMIWNTAEDTFNYDVKIPDQPNTRRGLLSTIFSIYDPLFLATPALIRAKRLFQITCAEKLGWDDPLPAHLTLVWMKWKEEVLHLTRYSLPRCYIASVIDSSEVKDIQLHVFTDGSEIAYGAVAYLRYEDSSNKIHTSIIMSKSRLTPLDRIFFNKLQPTFFIWRKSFWRSSFVFIFTKTLSPDEERWLQFVEENCVKKEYKNTSITPPEDNK